MISALVLMTLEDLRLLKYIEEAVEDQVSKTALPNPLDVKEQLQCECSPTARVDFFFFFWSSALTMCTIKNRNIHGNKSFCAS